ncbi:hypothetical protein ACEZDB_12475 [Streptacidiphilus sp. N1-3]|uniref:Uncharacterized protein n=1 Tax=Streptacidiphilus alkalitolerans TaxID=3342712 RepID=A0ABV6WZH6_9ACTN
MITALSSPTANRSPASILSCSPPLHGPRSLPGPHALPGLHALGAAAGGTGRAGAWTSKSSSTPPDRPLAALVDRFPQLQ